MAGTSFWTVWTSPAYGGSGSKRLGLLPHARSLAFSCAAFLRTNASAGPLAGIRPQPGALWLPWRTGRQATAPPLPQGPFLPAPISSVSGMAGPTRSRYSRSLSDFAKLVERLEAAGAVFVSVTQSFNTATSMGRLTLHMLLSFAQFEREVTAERIRDKVAASKRKGLWMGGRVPVLRKKSIRR